MYRSGAIGGGGEGMHGSTWAEGFSDPARATNTASLPTEPAADSQGTWPVWPSSAML